MCVMGKRSYASNRGVRGVCITGKRRFRDRFSALQALARAQHDPNPKRVEERAYRCPQCAGWHLTSKEYAA